ncbi:MAG: cell division protein FtsZ [Chloroflexi bacterium]|nr:cell division protein FtsZ [Chloroflexota bacterium]
MGKRGGFDPERLTNNPRPPLVVQQIIGPLDIEVTDITDLRAIGVGGAGGNAVERLIEASVLGVSFAVVNSDAQALSTSNALKRVQIGAQLTRGMGCGGDPALGRRSAEESYTELVDLVKDADLVFIAAGLGGGTGTGAAPVVAALARDAGALTVGVVSRPFSFEGRRRATVAEQGIKDMLEHVDALLIIPNDRLLQIAGKHMNLRDAFHLADEVMLQGIRGISDLITTTGLINVDFADVRAVLHRGGRAHLAIGAGYGPQKSQTAAQVVLQSPLLENPLTHATRLLVNCVGGEDLTLFEVNEFMSLLSAQVDPNASITVGAFIHPTLKDELRVTVIATGLP